MKIVQVVPHVGNLASGPSYSCVRLSQEIARNGHEVVLASLRDGQVSAQQNFSHRVYPKSGFPSFLWRSPELGDALGALSEASDLVHSNGLWVMPNVYPGWSAAKVGKPLVISTRGTVSDYAWNRSRWKKRFFWSAMQKKVVEQAALLHATSDEEYVDMRRRGFRQPVCIVPNGIDVPDEAKPASRPDGTRVCLFLARIHPTKGLDLLLKAWAHVSAHHPDWELHIAGPDNNGHLGEMQALAARLGVPRLHFLGPVYGAEKSNLFRRAELYVLPSRSENFAITVAEALAAGTPAIVTKGAPWGGIERQQAGWWIEFGLDSLVSCLNEALATSPAELREKGARGRRWVAEDYSWQRVAKEMISAYEWLLGRGDRPDFVRVD